MDPHHLRPGYWLDRYELLCPLAYGGMASVWLARFGGRAGFERLVVVKMILPQYSQDPRFQEMFLDEARIASRIEHANVARILDVGEHANGHFIVMEWVDGDSLSKLMRAADKNHEPMPAGVALRVCADAAAGLHAAHVLEDRDGSPLGVVHRDVSPQNILVANTGATMLIDFGIAKARDRVSQDTSAGQLKGKVRYMAPEQALGRAVDRRADIWSLGTILYELFAGQPAYDGDNEVATLHKLTSGEPPPPLPPSVPEAVREIIERALAYEVDARFETAMDLHLALESAMAKIGEPTSMANVAGYSKRLLAERQDLRRRTVDEALHEAHARDAMRTTSGMGMTNPGMTNPGMTNPGMTNPGVAMAIPPYPPSSGMHPFGQTDASGMLGTLGSAVVDYPAQAAMPMTMLPRGRRTAFMALGLCLLAALVGVILIVATTQARLAAVRTVDERAERAEEEALARAPRAASPAPNPAPVTTTTVATTVATTAAATAVDAGAAPTPATAASTNVAAGATAATSTGTHSSNTTVVRTSTSTTTSQATHGNTGGYTKTPTTGGKKNRGF